MPGDQDLRVQYEYFKNEGRRLAAEGKIRGAISQTEKAYKIQPSDKLKRRLDKLNEFLIKNDFSGSDEENAVDDSICDESSGFRVPDKVSRSLYPYQREGVKWLWSLHQAKKGGILGDDMGLGKTIQIIAFLSGLFNSDLIKYALIVMPVSLITNWNNELKKWAPNLSVRDFYSTSKPQREKNLIWIQKCGGIIITSYGMVVSNVHLFKKFKDRNFVWDYVVLDEGHKIKNATKTTKAIHEIPAKNRLVLSGTPIQNNLRELWALYDFSHQGTLLGSLPTFKQQYETPITRSREKNATAGDKRLGHMMAENLRHIIAPYFLRRTKEEVLNQDKDEKENKQPEGARARMKQLPQKNDLIIWLHLSDIQIQIYDDFTKTEHVKNLLNTKKSPLVALTVLKKICDHPRLLSKRACLQLGMNGDISQEELEKIIADEDTCAPSIDVDEEVLLKESGKLLILMELLEQLRKEGHRTLVFSQSRKMLDIINNILLNRDWNVLRLDGTMKKLEERQACINRFQNTNTYPVMLLTTQVGGVGLTITAADRVVIYDPSWNPATDSQAVDRCYRIGQTKPVIVYRLITCGTVEEKIYRRQIFKDSITKKTTGAHEDPHRYFTNMELRELFSLDDPRYSSTQQQLEDMHSHARILYPELERHLVYMHSLDIFGISDHDLMFKGNIKDPDIAAPAPNEDQEFIRIRVERARKLLQLESEEHHNENIRTGKFCKDLSSFQKSRGVLDKLQGELWNKPDLDNMGQPAEDVLSDVEVDINISEEDVNISEEDFANKQLDDLKKLCLVDKNFTEGLEKSLFVSEHGSPLKKVQKKKFINLPSTSTLDENEDSDLQRALQLSLMDLDRELSAKKEMHVSLCTPKENRPVKKDFEHSPKGNVEAKHVVKQDSFVNLDLSLNFSRDLEFENVISDLDRSPHVNIVKKENIIKKEHIGNPDRNVGLRSSSSNKKSITITDLDDDLESLPRKTINSPANSLSSTTDFLYQSRICSTPDINSKNSMNVESSKISPITDSAQPENVDFSRMFNDGELVQEDMDPDLEKAMELSLKIPILQPSLNDDEEDPELAQAIALSLKEAEATQRVQDELNKVLQLSLRESEARSVARRSICDDQDSDEELNRVLEMSLMESRRKSVNRRSRHLSSLSAIDQDFADALELSQKESTYYNEPTKFSPGSVGDVKVDQLTEADILVEDSDPEVTEEFGVMLSLRSRSSTTKAGRNSSVVYETDDELLDSRANSSRSSRNSSNIFPDGRTFGKHRPLSSDDEDSHESERSFKKSRMTPEVEDTTSLVQSVNRALEDSLNNASSASEESFRSVNVESGLI